MNTSKILLVLGLLSVASSFAFAGPGAQYYQQRRAERSRPAPAPAVVTVTARPETPCCRVTTVQRPIASHKLSFPVRKVECSGCAKMQAGQKCTS